MLLGGGVEYGMWRPQEEAVFTMRRKGNDES
jgi:hypothetical protein